MHHTLYTSYSPWLTNKSECGRALASANLRCHKPASCCALPHLQFPAVPIIAGTLDLTAVLSAAQRPQSSQGWTQNSEEEDYQASVYRAMNLRRASCSSLVVVKLGSSVGI